MKKLLCLYLVLACVFTLVSCERTDFPVTVGDTTIEAQPTRVVSLSPMTTEMLDAIGASAHLVGRSTECDYPASVTELPAMGTALNPDVDAIIDSQATLVLTTAPFERDAFQRLETHGIDLLCFSAADSLEEIKASYVTLATVMGGANKGPANGERAYEMLSKRLQTVADAVEGQARLTVCYLAGLDAAAPENSLPGELLGLIGGLNTVEGEQWQAQPQTDAQVIFCDESMVDALFADPAYAECEAVEIGRDRVIGLDSRLWERQGLRMADVLAQMAAGLYPECEIPVFSE